MPRYVVLANWTDQGVANFRDTLSRDDGTAQLANSVRAELTETFWCLGPYDIVGMLDAPDDETATAFSVQLSAAGNVRTSTLRAFTREEVEGIIAKTG